MATPTIKEIVPEVTGKTVKRLVFADYEDQNKSKRQTVLIEFTDGAKVQVNPWGTMFDAGCDVNYTPAVSEEEVQANMAKIAASVKDPALKKKIQAAIKKGGKGK